MNKSSLIIRERKDKTIEMKFTGPEKGNDMNKFMELLYGGFMQGLVLVGQISQDLNVQKQLYDYSAGVVNTALHKAFPKVVEAIKKQEELELEIVEAVERGEEVNEQTKELVKELKEKALSRMTAIATKSNHEKQIDLVENIKKDIEELNKQRQEIAEFIELKNNEKIENYFIKKLAETEEEIEDERFKLEMAENDLAKMESSLKNKIN